MPEPQGPARETAALRRSRRLPDRADVVVVGAGAAGVFALRELVRGGLTAIGLEARNRIGGRIFTRRTLARHPLELGAEFVHGPNNIVHQLAAEYGLTLVPHAGTAYSWWDGQLVPDDRLPRPPLAVLQEIRGLAERRRRSGGGAMPLAEFLGTPELSEIFERSAVTRRYVDQLIKNDHSVEPTSLTLEGWLEPDVTGFEANYRIDEGYSALLHRAAEADDLDIRLNRPVKRIEWEPGRVTCYASGAAVRSRAAIVTLPLGVLQQGDVEFDEPLPRSKVEALESLLPGKAFKMHTSFHALRGGRPFWPAGLAFLTSALDSQLHWPASQERRRGQRHLLTHLVGGDAADRFGQHPDPPQAMLNQLVHMFGNSRIRELFVRAEWRAWHTDPYSRSGYSAFPSDADLGARQALGQSVMDTLFFAGEAVGVKGRPGNVASVHGAIESGIQCARDAIASLRT
ncbi:MAG TPA: NAD(P)/FAD-dependent oxidoreductase [Pirellulaceae bacterium]|nr:NAD(P)/FAD-dependent oxidoreductase [Pirellulaceae bacterium]